MKVLVQPRVLSRGGDGGVGRRDRRGPAERRTLGLVEADQESGPAGVKRGKSGDCPLSVEWHPAPTWVRFHARLQAAAQDQQYRACLRPCPARTGPDQGAVFLLPRNLAERRPAYGEAARRADRARSALR